MSASDTYSNIKTVGSVVSSLSTAADEVVRAYVALKGTEISHQVKTGSHRLNVDQESKVVEAPASVLSVFRSSFQKTVATQKEEKTALVYTQAVFNACKDSGIQIQSPQNLIVQLDALSQSKGPMIEKKAAEVIKHLESQHHQVFCDQITAVVSHAARNTGFPEIRTIVKNGNRAIVARDTENRAIVTEMSFHPKTGALDLKTEILGVCDQSCKPILDKMAEELVRNGLTFSERKHKKTGGIPISVLTTGQHSLSAGSAGSSKTDQVRRLNQNEIKGR